MAFVDILLPTINRLTSLVMTLSGIAGQVLPEKFQPGDIRLFVSDQSDQPVENEPVVLAARRIIEARLGPVEWHTRKPIHGIAEQRHFLLDQSRASYVLYLDDDVFLESWVLGKLIEILSSEDCAFVGAFPAGLSYIHDIRPQQQTIEYWDGPVMPEAVDPDSQEWQRFHLHRAANLYHVSQTLPPGVVHTYKVAWIASCILYDRQKLLEVGGFSFWSRLPRYHSGEEVLVQNLLMRRWGGCAIIPSGTYYTQVPTTVLNDKGTVDGHALELLPEMVQNLEVRKHA